MRVRVVLVEPEGEVNVGLVARVVMNFGFHDLVIVRPKASIEEALNYASHARDLLRSARIAQSIEEAVAGSTLIAATSSKPGKGRDIVRVSVTPEQLASLAGSGDGLLSILFGRESIGLTRDEIALADVLVTIPASPQYPTLNLSHAVAIILYELFKRLQGGKGHVRPRPMMSERERRLIEMYINDVTRLIPLPEHKRARGVMALKRVIMRGRPTLTEAMAIITLFRRISEVLEGRV